MPAVIYEKQGRIAIITLNRPEALNSLSTQLRKELGEALLDFKNNNDLWVAIVTGAGDKAFCAGADIKEFKPGPMEDTWLRIRADQIWKPIIAAINGFALGGGLELAMECDIRIAVETARLGQPEVNIGFMPGAGGTQRLPRFVPRAMAAEILLTGEAITAQEAHRIGLINRVVPRDQLMAEAKKMAETICQKGPLGIRATKEAMMRGYNMTLEQGLEIERDMANRMRQTQDFMEGARAFAEKRKPNYQAK